jgi:hypothetical protein
MVNNSSETLLFSPIESFPKPQPDKATAMLLSDLRRMNLLCVGQSRLTLVKKNLAKG